MLLNELLDSNNTNNYDGSTFTLIDGAEDEADSSAGLFKQRFDILDFTDEVNKNLFFYLNNLNSEFFFSLVSI